MCVCVCVCVYVCVCMCVRLFVHVCVCVCVCVCTCVHNIPLYMFVSVVYLFCTCLYLQCVYSVHVCICTASILYMFVSAVYLFVFTPFTATACKISRLKSACIHSRQTADLSKDHAPRKCPLLSLLSTATPPILSPWQQTLFSSYQSPAGNNLPPTPPPTKAKKLTPSVKTRVGC